MKQKFIVLVYYKGFAPMEQEIPAVQNRIKFSVALGVPLSAGAGNAVLLPIVTIPDLIFYPRDRNTSFMFFASQQRLLPSLVYWLGTWCTAEQYFF